MLAFLVLETLMIGVLRHGPHLFYLFFEGGLIPMFLIIGIWGGGRRVYASFKFFLYTLLGSVLMLLAVLVMYWQTGTTFIPDLMETAFAPIGKIGYGWRFLPVLRSKCRCGRCIHGYRTRMWKRRPPVRLFWPVCC